MNKTITTISEEINSYIRSIEERHQQDYSTITELSVQYIGQKLENVKNQFELDEGISQEDEIFYFKNIKCRLLALIQYYILVQKIELRKPPRSRKKLKKYYLLKLYKIKKNLRRNRCCYNYYKSNSTGLDHIFFKRPNKHYFVLAGDYIMEVDKYSTTGFIHVFSQIEAHKMLRHYLKKKIKSFDQKGKPVLTEPASVLRWTTSKTDMIELIYGLHASGVFNNGRGEIKEIAEYFQIVFEIDLGQYNRYFLDIRNWKKNKTKFFDEAKQALIKRMNSTDNQLFP